MFFLPLSQLFSSTVCAYVRKFVCSSSSEDEERKKKVGRKSRVFHSIRKTAEFARTKSAQTHRQTDL